MLLDHGFGRSPQQLDIAHSVSDRPLEHLSSRRATGNEEGSSHGCVNLGVVRPSGTILKRAYVPSFLFGVYWGLCNSN